ncbi:hypothetical protein AX15_006124 [Amanita polypyramis BW_CC]|nr:hypothetical protein AX15_006124 [Amanita polypyramis BW_CC]
MSVGHSAGNPDIALDFRNIRIHKWISSVQSDIPQHQHNRSSSNAGSIIRADSPLLGFTAQENTSPDPLYRPSPDYIRRLPEEVRLSSKSASQDRPLQTPFPETRIPATVPEDAEQDVLLPSLMRNRFISSETRYPAHLSLTQTRPTLPRQPSLPVLRTSEVPPQAHDSAFTPRVRFHSTATPPFTHFPQSPATSPVSPAHVSHPPTPVMAMESPSPDLERQKLNALVIASGLAGEEDLQGNGVAYLCSPSQIHLGEPTPGDYHTPVKTESPLHQSPSPRDSGTSNLLYNTPLVSPRSQIISDSHSPRTSISLDDLDEFDEDASYYGKQIDPLFSPYSCPPSTSREAPPASKWSLSSSVEDLGSKRSSVSKSPKNKKEKFKSFMSRFSSSGASSSEEKHVLSFSVDSHERRISRQRSHSDVLETVTKRSSLSSPVQTVTYGLWESAPATPTTAVSATSMSISTSYSAASPSDNENDYNGSASSASSKHRTSDEKFITPRIESPVSLIQDTPLSLTWSEASTSSANNPVDVAPPPLLHSASMISLRTRGLMGLVSRIGTGLEENAQEDYSQEKKFTREIEAPPTPVRRTFMERIMSKNNDSALSLILGKGNSKNVRPKPKKPKRKLLIDGIEQGNYRKYEAISSWCEGFGEVTVNRKDNGVIVAEFKDANIANEVCRLQAQVHIRGAGSVNLSWTTKEF